MGYKSITVQEAIEQLSTLPSTSLLKVLINGTLYPMRIRDLEHGRVAIIPILEEA